MKVLVTLEALTPPCRDTFCRHAAPGAWPESARMREIRRKGIHSYIHLFMKVEIDAGETRTRKTLAGKSSRVPMRKFKKSPSVSSCQERVMKLPENVQTHLPGEGQPVHDEGSGEPVEVPAGEIDQKNKTKDLAKLKKPTIERQRANSHHSTPPAVLYFFKPVYFLAYENTTVWPILAILSQI